MREHIIPQKDRAISPIMVTRASICSTISSSIVANLISQTMVVTGIPSYQGIKAIKTRPARRRWKILKRVKTMTPAVPNLPISEALQESPRLFTAIATIRIKCLLQSKAKPYWPISDQELSMGHLFWQKVVILFYVELHHVKLLNRYWKNQWPVRN